MLISVTIPKGKGEGQYLLCKRVKEPHFPTKFYIKGLPLVMVRYLARRDWYYINIHNEQADALDKILQREGKKWGIKDRVQLIRLLIADFIEKYEEKNDLVAARKAVRLDSKRDAMKPMSIIL